MSLNQKCNSYIHFAVKANKVLWGLDFIKKSKFIPYVIIYDNTYAGSINNFDDFINQSDVIITNRMYKELLPYKYKTFTRDIYKRD